MWKCQCDCGKTTICFSANLRSGKAKSCGCAMYQDLSGRKFGRLTVVSLAEKRKGFYYWNCKCECGNEVVIKAGYLTNGDTKSCGCLYKERSSSKKHGYRRTRLYGIWCAIKTRCCNNKFKEYHNYGGRGIAICEEWKDNFQVFYDWAMANGYAENLTIDRFDNDGNYEPSNCRWITTKQNSRNRSNNVFLTVNGETKCVAEWCEVIPIKSSTAYWWIKKYGKEYAEKRIFEKLNL